MKLTFHYITKNMGKTILACFVPIGHRELRSSVQSCPVAKYSKKIRKIRKRHVVWLAGPEKVIWFLPARKSIFLAYSQHQEKIRKFLQKYGFRSSFTLDIISANHIGGLINTSTHTPLYICLTPEICQSYSNTVFFGEFTPCGAATLSRALLTAMNGLSDVTGHTNQVIWLVWLVWLIWLIWLV